MFELGPDLEPVEGVVPHRLEQLADRPERLAAGAVETPPTLRAHGDQPGFREPSQVLRDRAEGDVAELAVDLPGGAFGVPDQSQDLAPARRGENSQRLDHEN